MKYARGGTRLLVSLLAVALAGGCSIHNDPHYNPYASPRGEPRLLESADRLAEQIEEGVNNLDRRLENAVY